MLKCSPPVLAHEEHLCSSPDGKCDGGIQHLKWSNQITIVMSQMEAGVVSHASADCFVGSGSDRLCLKLGHTLGWKKLINTKGLGIPKNPHTILYYITTTTTTHTQFAATSAHRPTHLWCKRIKPLWSNSSAEQRPFWKDLGLFYFFSMGWAILLH